MQTLDEGEMEKYRDREVPLEDEELGGIEAAEKLGKSGLVREERY